MTDYSHSTKSIPRTAPVPKIDLNAVNNAKNADILRNPHHNSSQHPTGAKSPRSVIECQDLPTAEESLIFSRKAALLAAKNKASQPQSAQVPSHGSDSIRPPPLSPPPAPIQANQTENETGDFLLDVNLLKNVKRSGDISNSKDAKNKREKRLPRLNEPISEHCSAGDVVKPLGEVRKRDCYVIDIPHKPQPQLSIRSGSASVHQIQLKRRGKRIKDIDRSADHRTSLITMRNAKKITLEFTNMTFAIWEGKGKRRKEKQILKGINGTFEGGQLHCIMGPSGSGKTTLLNTLAGFNVKAAKALTVKIDNYRFEASKVFSGGNKFFCYITQDIELPAFLTVKETMAFATRLKMPRLPAGLTVSKYVDSLVGPLGLKSSLDTFVNNLSGGQRKRLAIATEIINYPPVLFADEPTSGLDSAMAEECIELFRQMADKGCNIITTIHQPSAKVFSLFNTLYCISRGECIYEGPTSYVLSRLNTIGLTPPPFYSAADYILDIALGEASEEKLQELIELTRKMQTEDNKDDGRNIINRVRNNRQQAAKSLAAHDANKGSDTLLTPISKLNRMLFLFRISGLIGIGLLMGGIFWGDSKSSTPQILAILSSALFTSSFMPAVMGIPLDVRFMKTEYLNSWYQMPALAISTAITDCLLEVVHPILFTIILWKMAALRRDDIRMLKSSVISVLSAWNGRSVGLLAGTFSSRMTSAYVAFGGMAPFFVFTGSVLPYNLAPIYLRWLFYINSCFYVFEAHLLQVYGGKYFHPSFNRTACQKNNISIQCIEQRQNYDGEFIISTAFGFEDNDDIFWKDLGILIGFFFFFRIVGSFSLYWRLKRELKRANNR